MKLLVATIVWQWLLIEWPWVAGAAVGVFVTAVLLGILLRFTRSSEEALPLKSVEQADTETELAPEAVEQADTETELAPEAVEQADTETELVPESVEQADTETELTLKTVEQADTPAEPEANDEQVRLQTARDERIRFEIEELHRARVEQRQRIEAEERLRKANVDVTHAASNGGSRKTAIPEKTKVPKIELGEDSRSTWSAGSTRHNRPPMEREEAFRFLTQLFDDPSTEVRNMAARALYDLQTDRAASFTRAMREGSPERRQRLASALATSGLAEEALANLSGPNLEKSYDAFAVLFLMVKVGEIQPLINAIEEMPNLDVRVGVVKLLALSGQSEVLAAFHRLAVRSSLPAQVRSAIMDAMHQLRSG